MEWGILWCFFAWKWGFYSSSFLYHCLCFGLLLLMLNSCSHWCSFYFIFFVMLQFMLYFLNILSQVVFLLIFKFAHGFQYMLIPPLLLSHQCYSYLAMNTNTDTHTHTQQKLIGYQHRKYSSGASQQCQIESMCLESLQTPKQSLWISCLVWDGTGCQKTWFTYLFIYLYKPLSISNTSIICQPLNMPVKLVVKINQALCESNKIWLNLWIGFLVEKQNNVIEVMERNINRFNCARFLSLDF